MRTLLKTLLSIFVLIPLSYGFCFADWERRDLSTEEIKEKTIALKNDLQQNYSGDLKADEKAVLDSAAGAMEKSPEEFYQSDMVERISNLMIRYLEEFVKSGESTEPDPAERFLGERYARRIKRKIQEAIMPQAVSLKEYVSSYLKNLKELEHVIQVAQEA